MSISKKRGFIRITDESELQKTNIWESPDYTDPDRPARETALNYDPSWTPSAPKEEEQIGRASCRERVFRAV